MAHSHAAVVVSSAVDSLAQDIELSRRAAALLARLKPCLDPEKVAHEMLDRQRAEKLERESRGLNHWDEYAPKFLARLVRQAREERLRRYQEAAAFYKAKHREIVRFARAIVGDSEAAEIVASDTYREVLEGSIPLAGFFTALVGNGRNYLARQSYRRQNFVSLDEAFTPSFGGADMEDEEGEAPSFEPVSRHLEDQDPLDILIAREEEEARRRLVSAAKEDPRWRYIKRRDWAAPLRGNVRN